MGGEIARRIIDPKSPDDRVYLARFYADFGAAYFGCKYWDYLMMRCGSSGEDLIAKGRDWEVAADAGWARRIAEQNHLI